MSLETLKTVQDRLRERALQLRYFVPPVYYVYFWHLSLPPDTAHD